jgi:soluble lytic murein transglycosylase-like protein
VALIREEKFKDALAFVRRQTKEVREWTGIMSLEAALLSQSDPGEALGVYDRIFAGKSRDVHFSRALTGYRRFLEGRSEKGDHSATFRLMKCLAHEWRNGEARDLVRKTLSEPGLPDSLKEEFLAFDAVLALREGDLDAAAERFGSKSDLSSLRWLSTLRAREGNHREAARHREKVAAAIKPGPRKLAELAKVFEILTKGGLTGEALALLEKHPELEDKVPSRSLDLGISSLVENEPEKALEYLDPATKEKGPLGIKALYFKGRALEKLSRFRDASKVYAEAAKRGLSGAAGGDYHAVLAEGRFLKLNDIPDSPDPAPGFLKYLESPTGEDRDTLGQFLWLSERLPPPWPDERVPPGLKKGPPNETERIAASVFHFLHGGDPQRALSELANAPPGFFGRKKPVPPTEIAARLALLAAGLGDYNLATKVLNTFEVKDPEAITGRWNHPLVYGKELRAANILTGLSPQLVLSVMRTESAFQRDAISASNARGLMQLLPSTAEKLSALLDSPAPRDEDLFLPSPNIRLGTAYLGMLVDSFQSVPLALASYNGGPFNILRLAEAKEGMDLDLFVETLPFSETSNYVRKVLESVHAYEKAYFGRARHPDLTVKVSPPKVPPPPF